MLFLVLTLFFFAVAGVIVGAYLFANRRELVEAEAARARLHGEAVAAAAGSQSILKEPEAVSGVALLDRILKGRAITERLQARLANTGSSQNPAVFLMTAAVLAMVGAWLGSRMGLLGTALVGALGFALPWMWLRGRERKRLADFEKQLPEALDMMANAMKAGYSFQAAARFLSEEVPAPLGPEFGRFYDEQRLGIEVRTALVSMQQRIDSLNLKMFVTAVLIQRETGGNLTELLSNLSTLMRERVVLRGQIETLAAEPKISGRFLAAIPLVMFLLFGLINPTFMAPLRSTSAGHVILGIAAISCVLGYVVMMKMADIDV